MKALILSLVLIFSLSASAFLSGPGGGGGSAGPITINTQTGNYVLVLADASSLIRMDVASANTVTVPPNSSVAFPVGTEINVSQVNTGQVTLTPGAGVTFVSADGLTRTRVQRSLVGMIKIDTNTWLLFGDLT